MMDGGPKRERTIRVARRVYVGNLAWQTSWQELKDFFSQVGTVKYADVMREGGPGSRSKGCGIVEFEVPEEAAAAIERLNHAELDGRQIFVREDREDFELRGSDAGESAGGGPRQPPKRRAGGGGGGGGSVAIGRRVYVGNLSYDTSWQEVKDHFKQAGHVLHADIMTDGEGASKGCALVEFESPTEALHAISMLSNSVLGDRQIMVREDREDPGSNAGGAGAPGARRVPRPVPVPAFGAQYGGGGGGAVGGVVGGAEGTQVVLHGLPYKLAWQELKDLCRPAGAVVRADVMTNADGTSKGYGIVQFASPVDAQAAIQMLNGTSFEGRILTAKLDRFAQ